MPTLLADYSSAADAVAGFTLLSGLLTFIYGIICLLVPVFIYRIMRRGTERYHALLRIETLLAQAPTKNSVSPLEFGTERPTVKGKVWEPFTPNKLGAKQPNKWGD